MRTIAEGHADHQLLGHQGTLDVCVVPTVVHVVPVSLVWLVNGMWLGRRQEKLAAAAVSPVPVPPAATAPDAFVAARP